MRSRNTPHAGDDCGDNNESHDVVLTARTVYQRLVGLALVRAPAVSSRKKFTFVPGTCGTMAMRPLEGAASLVNASVGFVQRYTQYLVTASVVFVFCVQLPMGADRDGVISKLAEQGIASKAYLPCIHLLPPYRERFGFKPGQFPVAERVADRSLALPFFTAMTESQVDRVCTALGEALNLSP